MLLKSTCIGRTRAHALVLCTAVCGLLFAAWRTALDAQTSAPQPTPLATMLEELKAAPRENPAREEKLRELYLSAGAKPDEVRFHEVSLNGAVAGRNLIVSRAGDTAVTLVFGAHLDKVTAGQGVIDDWSGCVLVKNLYAALRNVKTKHTLWFVGFSLEERGLQGSRQLVEKIMRDRDPIVVAMANFECLGVGGPFVWANGSNEKMKQLAHRVAQEKQLELTDHTINGVSADSLSFERVGIPSLTIDGLPLEKLRGIIHTENDNFSAVVPERFEAAYKLAIELALAMDKSF